MKLCNRMINVIENLKCFIMNDWNFHTMNSQFLYQSLSHADRRLFNFDLSDLNWDDYVTRWHLGIKKFVLNETMTDASMKVAQNNMTRLYWLHRILQLALMYATWCLVSSDISVSCLSVVFNEVVKLLALFSASSNTENTQSLHEL